MPKTIHLDGTTLEGGGQLLRIAIGLAALTQQPLQITDIRGNRSGGGGLKLQHLTCVQWLSRACGAPTQGAEKKSRLLNFFAKDHDQSSLKVVRGGWNHMDGVIDIGSPGAIGLVFQAILPYVLFAGALHGSEDVVHITIKGGTNVSNSPSIDYIQHVLLPTFERIGLPKIEARCRARGWSTGRMEMGAVTFAIQPLHKVKSLNGFELTNRGIIERIQVILLGPRSCEKILHRELDSALKEFELQDVAFDVSFEPSGHEKRLYLLLVAHTSNGHRLGRDHLFQERISSLDNAMPKLVRRTVKDLKIELDHDGCVDEFMADQLTIFQALAKGPCIVDTGSAETSLHTKTAYWVIKQMLGVDLEAAKTVGGASWIVGEKWTRRRTEDQDIVDSLSVLEVIDRTE